MRGFFRRVWVLALWLAPAACIRGPAFLEQSGGHASLLSSGTGATKAQVVRDENGVLVATLAATAGAAQIVEASAASAIAGSSIVFQPGAIAVDTEVTFEEGASVIQTATADAVGLAGAQAAGPAVVLSSSSEIQPTAPLTVSLVVSDGASLALADVPADRLFVMYQMQTTHGLKLGLLATRSITLTGRVASFAFQPSESFVKVAFQIGVADAEVKEAKDTDSTIAIVAAKDAPAVPAPPAQAVALGLASVVPPSGPSTGAQTVKIVGAGFAGGLHVYFDGVECNLLTVVSPTESTCVTPAHAVGKVDVKLVADDGRSASLLQSYEYLAPPPPPPAPAPTVTAVIPFHGTANGGMPAEIQGTGFLPGATVAIGPAACTQVQVVSPTSIRCVTSAAAPGSVQVLVNNPDGQSGSSVNAYTYLAGDVWTATSNVSAPAGRSDATVVWAGNRFVVWGGGDGTGPVNSGALYDPGSGIWSPMATAGAPQAGTQSTMIWTGSRAVVWGGYDTGSTTYIGGGGAYDPAGNAWTTVAVTGAPSARWQHTAVWTGSKMLVWGGGGSGGVLQDGGRYDPVTDSWQAINTTGAPSARQAHTAVWTGTEMLVWGGVAGGTALNTGARYDPATDTWTPMTTVNAPEGRYKTKGVWTGSKLLVWGGEISANDYSGTGGLYDPVTDTWTPITATGAPTQRGYLTTVWTGSEALFWGGVIEGASTTNTGYRYNPATDTWTAMATGNAPSSRQDHLAAWDGVEMLVWGGWYGSYMTSGGRYVP